MNLNTLIEANNFKAVGLDQDFFGLTEEEWATFIRGYIEEASLRLQSWVSEGTYRLALAKNESNFISTFNTGRVLSLSAFNFTRCFFTSSVGAKKTTIRG